MTVGTKILLCKTGLMSVIHAAQTAEAAGRKH